MVHEHMFKKLAALALAAFVLVFTGCPDEERLEERRGVEGEFCRDDLDCRDPLVCDESLCVDIRRLRSTRACELDRPVPGSMTCESACTRLTNTCNLEEPNCLDRCNTTIQCWSTAAADIFINCLDGMTMPTLTCEEVNTLNAVTGDSNGYSVCFNQIPLAEERETRCERITQRASGLSTINVTQAQVDTLSNTCRVAARAAAEDIWSRSDGCDDGDLSEADFIVCVERAFEITLAEVDTSGSTTENNTTNNSTTDPAQ